MKNLFYAFMSSGNRFLIMKGRKLFSLCLSFFIVISPIYNQAFITTWRTSNPGISGPTSISIPTHPGFAYDYDVNWDNDGNYEILNISGDITHDFGSSGNYTIRIRGKFPAIYFNNTGDKDKISLSGKAQEKLLRSLESNFEAMEKIVRHYA